ncbi:MAG: hypothetical protein GF331_23990, partial [Chitinivibrionales bacterium]|nr:hypothetical protein [Chitinivibrionales bacterium]
MKKSYRQNLTSEGYLMQYRRDDAHPHGKTRAYQFYVELEGIAPLIWRRIQVPCN